MRQIQPDKQKAKSLLQMAEITLQRIYETDITKYPSNVLKDYYDVIHSILEAILYNIGKKTSGEGAHEQLISEVCHIYKIPDQYFIFMQDLRHIRNRIAYEGFSIESSYVLRNKEKIEKIIVVLKQVVVGIK